VVSRAAPVRTCVGCRNRAPASELLRVVAVEHNTIHDVSVPTGRATGKAVMSVVPNHRVVPDPNHRLPGRGAHVHPDPTCLALAVRRRAFGRALRVSGVPDTGLLTEFVVTR
jgi:uncharacterized protein